MFPGGGGALGPNMYGCVPLRCCDDTLSGSKGSRKYTVVLSGSKNLKRVYPFGSIFAENDTRLGSKNGENYTLSSGTYPVPKTSKCPPPPPGIMFCNFFKDARPLTIFPLPDLNWSPQFSLSFISFFSSF